MDRPTINELIERNKNSTVPRISIAEMQRDENLLKATRAAQGTIQNLISELSNNLLDTEKAIEALQIVDDIVLSIEIVYGRGQPEAC